VGSFMREFYQSDPERPASLWRTGSLRRSVSTKVDTHRCTARPGFR